MLQLYVSEHRCGWLDACGNPHWQDGGDFSARLDQSFQAANARPQRAWARRPTVTVWMSGSFVRPFLLGPVTGLRKQREVHSFVQSQVAEATGLSAPSDIQVEGDIAKEVVLVTAMLAESRAQIESAIQRAGLRLRSLRPWWAGVLDEALATQPDLELLAVEDADSLTLLSTSQGAWATAETFTPPPDSERTRNSIRRLASGAGIDPASSACFGLGDDAGVSVDNLWPTARRVLTTSQP